MEFVKNCVLIPIFNTISLYAIRFIQLYCRDIVASDAVQHQGLLNVD